MLKHYYVNLCIVRYDLEDEYAEIRKDGYSIIFFIVSVRDVPKCIIYIFNKICWDYYFRYMDMQHNI